MAGALGFMAFHGACVDPEATFYIVTPLPVDATMGVCAQFTAGGAVCSSLNTHGGASATGSRAACFAVASELIPRARDDAGRPETNRILLNEADVEVTDANGTTVNAFSTPVTGVVDPQRPSAATSNAGVALIPIVSDASKLTVGEGYVAGVILKGRTLGGTDVETPEFFVEVGSVGSDPCLELDSSGMAMENASCCGAN